jgi:hypothetical protein
MTVPACDEQTGSAAHTFHLTRCVFVQSAWLLKVIGRSGGGPLILDFPYSLGLYQVTPPMLMASWNPRGGEGLALPICSGC